MTAEKEAGGDSNSPTEQKSFFQRITDFSDWTKETWIYVGIFIGLILASLWLFYEMYLDETFLFGLVIRYFVQPVSKMGAAGWGLFLLFMAIQGMLVPIPSELVLLSSGMIWGLWGGALLGILGSMLAGMLCFYVSKKGGRPLVEKFIGTDAIELVDVYIEKYGAPMIFLTRAFPFMAFDPISYVSGLVKIDVKKYALATFLGSIIRAFFYAWLGATLMGDRDITSLTEEEIDIMISEQGAQFNILLAIIIAVLAVSFLLYQFVLTPYMKKKRDEIVVNETATKNAESAEKAVKSDIRALENEQQQK